MPLAVLLALCPAVAGIARNSWTAGGADQYAYVSQADLWLQRRSHGADPSRRDGSVAGSLAHVHAARVSARGVRPCPRPRHGARASAADGRREERSPVTARCFSSRRSAARCSCGSRLPSAAVSSSDALGLAAAWLVATSPAVLAMLVSPMSDVPAAAFWAVAIYFTLGSSSRSALMAGLAASAAILIRPNLAPLAASAGDLEMLIGDGWPEGQHYERQRQERIGSADLQVARAVLP